LELDEQIDQQAGGQEKGNGDEGFLKVKVGLATVFAAKIFFKT